MKIAELREILDTVSTIHLRLGSSETASDLKELSDGLRVWDDKTVAAFVKLAGTKVKGK